MRSSDWSSDVCSSDLAGRIAHGTLSASFISTVFGTRLPGPGCIYLRQDLRFKAPVKIGDTVEARVTVKEIQAAKKRVVFDTVCTVRDRSEEHTSELQSLMRISYAVFCLKKKKTQHVT